MCAGIGNFNQGSLPHEALLRLVNIAFDHLCGVVVTVLGEKNGESRDWWWRVRRCRSRWWKEVRRIKLTSGLEGVQVFLSGPIEPSDRASQLPNFAVNEIAVEAKTISRINLNFPCVAP